MCGDGETGVSPSPSLYLSYCFHYIFVDSPSRISLLRTGQLDFHRMGSDRGEAKALTERPTFRHAACKIGGVSSEQADGKTRRRAAPGARSGSQDPNRTRSSINFILRFRDFYLPRSCKLTAQNRKRMAAARSKMPRRSENFICDLDVVAAGTVAPCAPIDTIAGFVNFLGAADLRGDRLK